jgi:hypothetical protein
MSSKSIDPYFMITFIFKKSFEKVSQSEQIYLKWDEVIWSPNTTSPRFNVDPGLENFTLPWSGQYSLKSVNIDSTKQILFAYSITLSPKEKVVNLNIGKVGYFIFTCNCAYLGYNNCPMPQCNLPCSNESPCKIIMKGRKTHKN